jgi:hypothetical protein
MALPVTFVAGDVLEAAQLNSNFSYLDAGGQVASFTEYQAAGTNGGTATSGAWTKRTLNTTVLNTITGCTLTTSVIALPAGTYRIDASSSFVGVNACSIKLRNTTDSTDTILGTATFDGAPGVGGSPVPLSGAFTIAGTKNFEIQYRVATTRSSDGLGAGANFGVNECFTSVTIEKVA